MYTYTYLACFRNSQSKGGEVSMVFYFVFPCIYFSILIVCVKGSAHVKYIHDFVSLFLTFVRNTWVNFVILLCFSSVFTCRVYLWEDGKKWWKKASFKESWSFLQKMFAKCESHAWVMKIGQRYLLNTIHQTLVAIVFRDFR